MFRIQPRDVNLQKTTRFLCREVILALMIILLLIGCMPPAVGTVTSTPEMAAVPNSNPPGGAPADTPLPDGASLTFITDADARVEESSPDENFGRGETLRVEGGEDPDVESFIRFTVSGVTKTVGRAQLRLYTASNDTIDGPAVYSTDASWTEEGITWNTRPARTSDATDDKVRIGPESWVEYDVTPLVTGNGTFSFILAGDSTDSVAFSSRESSQPPQLVLTLGVLPTATPAPTLSEGAAILVGAGDISTCSNDNDELTAQLLDTIPGTVFTTGDNAYSSGTFSQFSKCYDPTWGRHKERTRPVPGNHEYRTPGAQGYFEYFDSIPPYYAYDLGSWRIYALNSEIDVAADSPQVAWLQADLAANPRQCVLAYWHQPRWSSGEGHGNNPASQMLWEIFYEAGAEVVLNGHEHSYERFAPMNAQGESDPLGLREFVVGTGGGSIYNFSTPLPTSEVRNSGTYGVLKLTLHDGSYDWEFVPVASSTFTDRGSTSCH